MLIRQKRIFLLYSLVAFLLLFSSCPNSMLEKEAEKDAAGVSVELLLNQGGRTVMPSQASFESVISYYQIAATGQSGSASGQSYTHPVDVSTPVSNPIEINGLLPGDWNFAVSAYNSSDVKVAEGSAVFTVVSGDSTSNSFSLDVPFTNLQSGTGDVSVTLDWPVAKNITSVIPVWNGTDEADIYSSGNSVTYSKTGVASGNHILGFKIIESAYSPKCVYSTSVVVFDNLTSSASINLTSADFSAPAAPVNFQALVNGSGQVELLWDASAIYTESGFEIERSDSSSFSSSTALSAGKDASSCVDTGASTSSEAYYRIRSVNTWGASDWQTCFFSDPLNSMAANWQFNNDLTDSAGNYTATVSGTETYVTDVPAGSSLANSFSFDGTTQLDISLIDPGNQFSISVWVNTPADNGQINTIFANSIDGGRSDGFKVFINSWNTSDHSIQIETGDGSGTKTVVTPESTFTASVWTHLVFVLDKTGGTGTIYMNGNQVASGEILQTFNTNSLAATGAVTNGYFKFSGAMHDLRIYNAALNSSQVSQIYGEF